MSAAAYTFAWRYGAKSGITGNHLLCILYMAEKAKERKPPFIVEVPAEEISKHLRVTERYVRIMIAEMLESGHLQLIQKGAGQLPNVYAFGRRGVNYSSLQGVNPSSLLREDSTEVA